MTLLALMTLMGLTLVLVTSQGRLSALAAARSSLQPEHDSKELSVVLTEVVTGSTDPNSSFGAHGLLEDLYGLPQFFGRIFAATAQPAILPIGQTAAAANSFGYTSNGQLLQLTVVAAKPTGAVGLGPQSAMQYVLPQNSGAFCGQVVTMLTGPAAGQSARVVGYLYDANVGGVSATMQVSSFNGIVPSVGDEFVINGRPFSGTGFGLDLTQFRGPAGWQAPGILTTPTNGNVPLLTAVENAVLPAANLPASGMPYAYLPNHARITLTPWQPTTVGGTYWDPAGPGGANEPYDAPDFQNLMLAMHTWNPASNSVVTPIPSLHRPELVGWYYYQSQLSGDFSYSMGNPAGGANMLATRSKVILRPEPTYHFFNDSNGNQIWDAREPFQDTDGSGAYSTGDAFLDLNGNNAWDAGETDYTGKTFNPITGAWYITATGQWRLDPAGGLDVDNDMDGVPDSIWVDAGLQVQKGADGKLYKNLAAVLCIDLDGKVNLNAHGTLAQLDPTRYTFGASLAGPFAGNSVAPNTPTFYAANAAYTALNGGYDPYQRNVPAGQGYGPADVNPVHLFARNHALGNDVLSYYQTFLLGYDNPGLSTPAPASPLPISVDGRYGESSRIMTASSAFPGVYPLGSYSYTAPPITPTQMLLNGPRPGWSQWFDAFDTFQLVQSGFTAYWVNDPVALARFSDIRPGLLTPPASNATPFFFDFLGGALNHLPTAHGTPSDMHSRGFLATDLAGRPYYGGTAIIPWQTSPALWSTTMTDQAAINYSAIPNLNPFLQYETVLNDGVDTQYEMDLTQNAGQGAQNTGNSTNNVADYATIDAKISPSELEGVLRSHERSASGGGNSQALVQRLDDIETLAAFNLAAKTGATPPPNSIPNKLGDDSVRLAVTSESWDLSAPNIALTPQQMSDLTFYANNIVPAPAMPNLNSVSIADLARVRIFNENYGNANFVNISMPSGADLALFGNLKNIQQNGSSFPLNVALAPPLYPVLPLLSPDLILGMRLDVNRLLGNGMDDNGNGVVDEPGEVLWFDTANGVWKGEWLPYPFSQLSTAPAPVGQMNGPIKNMLAMLDLNNDGFYPTNPATGMSVLVDPQTGITLPGDPTEADLRARQLLAKHLYCLMMLLLDDRVLANPTVAAQIFNSNGAALPSGWPAYKSLGAREQAAYVIAQWAINVVDFRDRDSIMTPFEFDLYPFHADQPVVPLPPSATANLYLTATWNVDDIIDPAGGAIVPYSRNDDGAAWRGLVWGCERPELLMTETVAFHDRGTANTSNGQVTSGNDAFVGQQPPPPNPDTDYDQVRRPRGSLIVELFNPSSYSDAPQADMAQPWNQADVNLNQGLGVNLAQVAVVQPVAAGPLASPVWRIAIAYSPWQAAEASFYTTPQGVTAPSGPAPFGGFGYSHSPAGLSTQLDPRVPVLPPGAIHRAVYFTPYQASFVTPGSTPAANTVGDTLLNSSFFGDPNAYGVASVMPTLMVPPGQYALVGPANQSAAGAPFFIFAGQSGTWSLQMRNPVYVTPNPINAPFNTLASVNMGTPVGPYGAGYSLTAATSATVKPVIGVPIQTTWLVNATTGTGAMYLPHTAVGPGTPVTTLRMSVSEPEHGYPVLPGASGVTAWDDDKYNTPYPQHPFDSSQQSNNAGNATLQYGDAPNAYVAPKVADTTVNQPWTQPGYTVLYLQRLANPLQAFDLNVNPYITVDSMPVDLTAYTGELSPGAPAMTADPIAGSNTGIDGQNGTPSFDTRRRGYSADGSTMLGVAASVLPNVQPPNVWAPLPVGPAVSSTTYQNTAAAVGPPAVAAKQPYGNQYNTGSLATPMPRSAGPGSVGSTLGWINYEYSGGLYYTANAGQTGASGIPSYMYNGDPITPFPWLAWNNRPYVSQYELMLVPASSPSSQAQDFGMLGWQSSGVSSINEYQPGVPLLANTLPVSQFAQLLNFFDNQQSLVLTSDAAVSMQAQLPNLARVFEFLCVPSRYTGTQDMLNPSQFSGDIAGQSSGLPVSHLFHTPFNWLSRYREPGRINLNTLFDPVVFQSLTDDYPGALFPATAPGDPMTNPSITSLWWKLAQSRQGFANPTFTPANPPNPISQFNPATPLGNYPTYFANPFRPDGSGAFVPQTTMAMNSATTAPPTWQSVLMHGWNYPGITPPPGGLPPFNNGINATLLRSQAASSYPTSNAAAVPPAPSIPGPLAMLDDTAFDTNNLGVTYMSTALSNAAGTPPPPALSPAKTLYRHAAQNAAFQYQMFTRLGNTTTNRSNVYAIWITLGKFEVQAVKVTPQNPDGYKLIGPAFDDAGNQVHTRGFYIFDRSIPMGFQRGQDMNIERGMLVERVLE